MVANLLIGGHDTTSSQIGCTVLTMLTRPQIMAEVRADPKILASMMSESIRLEPSIAASGRVALETVDIGGLACPTGSVILPNTMTANRDPLAWDDPDSFVPRRFMAKDAPRMLTFGGGPHHCLGAWLARMTLEEVVRGVSALDPRLIIDADAIPRVQVLGQNPARLPVAV